MSVSQVEGAMMDGLDVSLSDGLATEAMQAGGPPTRGARRRSETRRRLLRAARTVFAREGLESATITQITRAADVGFGTFYLHFATKEEAYRAVVNEGFGELAREVMRGRLAAQERGAPWWESVRASVRAYCIFAERNRELFQVMFAGGPAGIGLGRSLQEQFADLLAAQIVAESSQMSEAHGGGGAGVAVPPPPYPYSAAQVVALATIVALTRSTLWWLAATDDVERDGESAADDLRPREPREPRPTLDELIETLTRYITAALWGQLPSA